MRFSVLTGNLELKYEAYIQGLNSSLYNVGSSYPMGMPLRSDHIVNEIWKILSTLPKYASKWRYDKALYYYFITHQKKVADRSFLLYKSFLLLEVLKGNTNELVNISEKAKEIYNPAKIHDIGKINIRKGLISLSKIYTEGDMKEMIQHTSNGKAITQSLGLPEIYQNVAQYHHERWDGSGYHSLRGEEIPLEASIVGIADTLESIQSRIRRYENIRFKSNKSAANIVRQEFDKGKFDPKLRNAFEYCAANYKEFADN
jgi:hypothetical protein